MKTQVRNLMWIEKDDPTGFWSVRVVKHAHGPYGVCGGHWVSFKNVVWC